MEARTRLNGRRLCVQNWRLVAVLFSKEQIVIRLGVSESELRDNSENDAAEFKALCGIAPSFVVQRWAGALHWGSWVDHSAYCLKGEEKARAA